MRLCVIISINRNQAKNAKSRKRITAKRLGEIKKRVHFSSVLTEKSVSLFFIISIKFYAAKVPPLLSNVMPSTFVISFLYFVATCATASAEKGLARPTASATVPI